MPFHSSNEIKSVISCSNTVPRGIAKRRKEGNLKSNWSSGTVSNYLFFSISTLLILEKTISILERDFFRSDPTSPVYNVSSYSGREKMISGKNNRWEDLFSW